VLLNLLVNAGDALEGRAGAEVRITGRREGARVVLQGPEKGTGLGLALSQELVAQFGGTLVAENRAEGGARLHLEFPVHPRTSG